jgi:prepilin-type N-terminal cleavage/methylation domain-containing protein
MKKTNKKGFTLAELLVVVAIIAVLVAIAIPIFTSQLEKAKESTDAANLRALYAETATQALENDGAATESKEGVELTQTGDWEYIDEIADVKVDKIPTSGTVYCNIASDGTVSFVTK